MKIEVNNIPEYAEFYKYIVASVCGNELWFYGAYNGIQEAHKAANAISPAVVLVNEDLKKWK